MLHRPFFKENSTTTTRPFYDASAEGKNCPSLNSCLEKGPNLIELVTDILLRFRIGKMIRLDLFAWFRSVLKFYYRRLGLLNCRGMTKLVNLLKKGSITRLMN